MMNKILNKLLVNYLLCKTCDGFLDDRNYDPNDMILVEFLIKSI